MPRDEHVTQARSGNRPSLNAALQRTLREPLWGMPVSRLVRREMR